MKNQANWQPTKFRLNNGELHVNKKMSSLNVSSWLIAECTARVYGKYLPIYTQGDLLDLGCGNCPLHELYQPFTSSIFCVDWENSLHANPYNDIAADISQPLDLLDSSFDTIILSDVLEHIFNPIDVLRESHRILKDNGVILINVPFLYWIHESPNDFYRYTEFGLRKLAQTTNFKVEVLEVVGGSLETWTDITSKISSYVPIFRAILPRGLFELICLLRKSRFLNRKLATLDTLFPTGYFMILRKMG
jgi:SAM-dependent methyltransferase